MTAGHRAHGHARGHPRGPIAVEQSVTETELVAIVRQAAAAGLTMKAVGRFRSPTGPGAPAAGTSEGIIISLAGYGRILRVDRDRHVVTVQAGISLRALHHGLAARGLSLANGPDNPIQSIGAAISTGAHGTGARFPGLAGELVSLELITATGELMACSADADESPDVFGAVRVGLGAVGVISTVTVRCEPAFNLRRQIGLARLEDVLASFDQQADGNDHFELSWIAGTPWARTFRANRTDEPRGADRSHRVFPDRRLRADMVEYSLPRTAAVAAIGQLRGRGQQRGRAAPFPIRIRVTAGDDIPLSTANGRPSVYIAVPAGPLAQFLDELGGRPQWTARHGATAATLCGRYPRWDEWHAVRQRLDPERRFASAFTEAVLGT